MIATIFLVLITKFTYERRDEDERKRLEKEHQQIQDDVGGIHDSLVASTNSQRYGTFTNSQSQRGSGNQLLQDSNTWR